MPTDLASCSPELIREFNKRVRWKISLWNPKNLFNNDWQWHLENDKVVPLCILVGESKKHHMEIRVHMNSILEGEGKLWVTKYNSSLFPRLGSVYYCNNETFRNNYSKFKKLFGKLQKIYVREMKKGLKEIKKRKELEKRKIDQELQNLIKDLG